MGKPTLSLTRIIKKDESMDMMTLETCRISPSSPTISAFVDVQLV